MTGKKILLVEGTDDEHVIKAIFGQRSLQNLDKIEPHGGIEKLLEAFPVRLKESNIESLGVVIDADTDLLARWKSVHNRLVEAGYKNVPTNSVVTGSIIESPANSLLPRVGIWIMPDNNTAGKLEDFLRFLVPNNSLLFKHAQQSIATIPNTDKRFTKNAEPKALIHTWLAWQREPGKPLGLSITAHFLNHEVPQVDDFVAWLQKLFDL